MKIVSLEGILQPRKDPAPIPGLMDLLKKEEEKMGLKYGITRVQRRSLPKEIPGRNSIDAMAKRKAAIREQAKKRG